MNKKGFTLIESLLFFSLVLLIVQYLCLMFDSLNHLKEVQKNHDKYYEEAYNEAYKEMDDE